MSKGREKGLREQLRQQANLLAIRQDQVAKLEAEIDQVYTWLSDLEARRVEEAEYAAELESLAISLVSLAEHLGVTAQDLFGRLFVAELESCVLRANLAEALGEIARRDKEAQAEAARKAEVARVARLMPNRNWITNAGVIRFRADRTEVILYPGGAWNEASKYAGGVLKSRDLISTGTVVLVLPLIGRMTIDNVEIKRTETFKTPEFTDFSQEFAFRLNVGGLVFDYTFTSSGWVHDDGGQRVANLKVTRREWCPTCREFHNPAVELASWFIEA